MVGGWGEAEVGGTDAATAVMARRSSCSVIARTPITVIAARLSTPVAMPTAITAGRWRGTHPQRSGLDRRPVGGQE
ncbi:hypothetical protein, partial [Frankia sp. Cr1]